MRMEESGVAKWFGQLRDVMYDVDDIIDLARFKGSMLLPDHPSSSSSKSTDWCGLSLSSCFSHIRTRHEVALKIRSLNKKIENISKDKVFFELRSTPHTRNGSIWTPKKTANLVEPNLVGKKVLQASRELVDLVCKHNGKKVYKIAIVGTGGVGKTTLAQRIFNDTKIKEHFNKLAWVCVTRDYSEESLLKEVLHQYMKVPLEQDESVAMLQSKLQSAIEDKSFFLVLDDVWKSDTWTHLLRVPLHTASTGIVVVTTQQDTISSEIGADHTHQVDLMEVNEGWELLWKSMSIDEERKVRHLWDIGIEIVRKCGGLSLAITVIAKVLASKGEEENEWRKVLGKIETSLSDLQNEIIGVLHTSYVDLPHPLQQCFLYCAVFPEDEAIFRDDLIRMWVAEGFINEQEGQLLEDTAEDYYYELIHWNLLQPYNFHFDKFICKMHDLLRKLACYLSREELFVGDPKKLGGNTMCKVRRISVVAQKDTGSLHSMDEEQNKVRTFKASNQSIGALQNLQILNLQRCKALHSLPLATTKLCKLRRLGLGNTPINKVILIDCKCCIHLPPIGQLPSLKYLQVQGVANVTKIGPEFLGCCVGNITPKDAIAFPKLEVLVIEDMPNWEEWSFVEGEGDEQVPRMQLLPSLKTVNLLQCPKLRGLLRRFGQEASKLEDLLIILKQTA
ncbi:hypothetical protein ABZP36_008693 [Zizania latifolia]